MKTTTPQKISRRDKVVDSMAKKFADHGSVTQIIATHRKRRKRVEVYVYIFIATSIISTLFTTLVMTGKVAPGLLESDEGESAVHVKSGFDFINEDLSNDVISHDEYALFLTDYLIRYDSLPARYKTPFPTTTSTEVYRALYTVWPQVNLRVRSSILTTMPYLEDLWRSLAIEQTQ